MLNSEHQRHQRHQKHHLKHPKVQRSEEHKQQNRHQIKTIDEFTVARIGRLWEQWSQADRRNGSNKHKFYRQVVNKATGLANVRLATVYVLLARLAAAQHQDAPQIGAYLRNSPTTTRPTNAEAGPI